jgi:hydroxymethylpyrimidine pyrophosphatase-like HAD family hydrolase
LTGTWEEDAAYSTLLDQGWDLAIAREACYAALAAVGADRMHFRPAEEMNSHKLTCGVRADTVDDAVARVTRMLTKEGVAHKAIISGKGDWRYVDVVPIKAGKLPALEHARRRLGFAALETVACGDSGNDIDMLEGDHLAVVVGNAQPDLAAWVAAQKKNGGGEKLTMVNGHRAWGVLEGLQTLGFR